MALLLLTNTAGADLENVTVSNGTTTPSYSLNDLISGPRSRMWRRNMTSSTSTVAMEMKHSRSLTHAVIARADLMLTKAGTTFSVAYHNGSSQTTIQSYAPVAQSDLVGIKVDGKPHGQDLVCEFAAPINAANFRIVMDAAGGASEATLVSKLFFSSAFDFGVAPSFQPQWSLSRESNQELVKPLMGYEEYEVGEAIQIVWKFVTLAKLFEFEALPLNWPLFLYDKRGDIFSHRLEHVIVSDPWTWTRRSAEYFDVTVNFRRLAHYP